MRRKPSKEFLSFRKYDSLANDCSGWGSDDGAGQAQFRLRSVGTSLSEVLAQSDRRDSRLGHFEYLRKEDQQRCSKQRIKECSFG